VVPELRHAAAVILAPMKADERNPDDAADMLCGECKFVVATLHAEPATQFA
jgi:hypothetical protein